MTRPVGDTRLLLVDRDLSELRPEGSRSRGELGEDDFRRTLTEMFGLALSEDELLELMRLTAS